MREETYRLLMRLHAQSGDRLGAARVYKRCSGVLERDMGVEPSPETREVHERVLQASVQANDGHHLPLLPRKPRSTNLPVELTSFVGREREKDVVKKLVVDQRLVMLTGTAGIGKTRLALKVAAGFVDAFTHGASRVGEHVPRGATWLATRSWCNRVQDTPPLGCEALSIAVRVDNRAGGGFVSGALIAKWIVRMEAPPQ